MELRKAFLKDILELQKICIDAYAKNFYNHWEEGGLEWYLEKEFSEKNYALTWKRKTRIIILLNKSKKM